MLAAFLSLLLLLPVGVRGLFPGASPEDGDYRHLYPKVCLAINVRHHEHSLPYSLGMVENLRYPKDRMHIMLIAEEDAADQETVDTAKYWMSEIKSFYLSVTVTENAKNWREESLLWARGKACGFAFITSADNFLVESSLKQLVDLKFVAVSPLLNGPFGRYSNVHELLDSQFIEREKRGSQQAYYLNDPILINLKNTDSSYLTFDPDNIRNYEGSADPIQVFAFSAFTMKIPLFFDNRAFYGYLLSSTYYSLSFHKKLLGYFLANIVSENGPIPLPQSSVLDPWFPMPSQWGFDQIYVVNLKRRPERLRKIDLIMRLLGIDYRVYEAVDGAALTNEQLGLLRFLPGYEDPYHKRPMKTGEIGCFLSHYGIWNNVVQRGYDRVLVFEDDVRFSENSTTQLLGVIEDIMKTHLEWDLIYLGRKKMTPAGDEFFVPRHRYLSTLAYSYWTLGYALTRQGAEKLLAARPLTKMLALDEFLPIMYGQHPNQEWASYFEPRNLIAFAVYPVIVAPERYTHEQGYISDTEASRVIHIEGNGSHKHVRVHGNELRSHIHASAATSHDL